MKKRLFLVIIIILLLAAIAVGAFFLIKNIKKMGLIDDWEYVPKNEEFEGINQKAGGVMVQSAISTVDDGNIGFTAGGAQNVDNFRENIENNYFPTFTDITYNGLFSEYYFDLSKEGENKKDEMFYPTYSMAVSKDPISGDLEKYISVGLNSNIKEEDFKREKLNLVIVLDISGSMGSSMTNYYYDYNQEKEEYKSKMKVAEKCINNLLDKLNEDDRLGIVLFDNEAYLGKKIRIVKETDIEAIKGHILEIEDAGGTNFSAGYEMGTDLYKDYINEEGYQNRIIFITDAMPNIGDTDSDSLLNKMKKNAEKGIFTTFIGVGVDFNTKVIEKITNVEGANYYAVHSSEEFNKILVEEFDYMVTPMVFDLDFEVESEKYEIEAIYGTDSGDKSSGNIMHANTLFPSSSNEKGEVKGGIILLKIKEKDKNSIDNKITLKVSYKDKNNEKHEVKEEIEFTKEEENYDNTGIEKGIVLSRYVDMMKNWILYERVENRTYLITATTGIICGDYDSRAIEKILGEHERRSTKLSVSEEYKENFKKLKDYMKEEKDKIKDEDLKKEIKILEKLIEM